MENIVHETQTLLDHPEEYQRMANIKNPYGDGKSAERIVTDSVPNLFNESPMNKFQLESFILQWNRWDSIRPAGAASDDGTEQNLSHSLHRSSTFVLTIFSGKIQGKEWGFKSSLQRINERLLVYTPPAFPPFSQYFQWINSFHTSLLVLLTKRFIEETVF